VLVSRLRLKNWRNFRNLEVPLHEVSYVLGPNASGKSNLLDVFRFLRDVSKPRGGGLQTAISDRGGISKLRCLHARAHPEVVVDVELSETADGPMQWRYLLGFKSEGKGLQRVLVSREEVWKGDKRLLERPGPGEEQDLALLTQTHLEQIQAFVDLGRNPPIDLLQRQSPAGPMMVRGPVPKASLLPRTRLPAVRVVPLPGASRWTMRCAS